MDVIERMNAEKKERMEELKRKFPEVMKHLVLNGLEVNRALILGELKIFEEGVEIRCPSRGRMKNAATAYVAAKNLSRCVLLVRGCGGRRSGQIEGPAVKWSYSDGHGGTLWAVLEMGLFGAAEEETRGRRGGKREKKTEREKMLLSRSNK